MLRSIRSRVIALSLLITFSVLLSLLSICYISLRSFLENSLIQTTCYDLQIAMENIEREIDILDQMINWFSINSDINFFLSSSNRTSFDWRQKRMAAWNALKNTSYGNSLHQYINKLLVCDTRNSGIQIGTEAGFETDWRIANEVLTDKNRVIVDNPFYAPLSEKIFVLSKKLYYDDQITTLGSIYICLNPALITSYLTVDWFPMYPDTDLFIKISSDYYTMDSTGQLIEVLEYPAFDSSLDIIRNYEWQNDKKTFVLVTGKSSGITLVRSIPTVQFSQQNDIFRNIFYLIILFLLLMIFLILITFNQTVNKPIVRINKHIDRIAAGNFTADPSLEFSNELGNIGRGINRLAENVEQLIETRIKDEALKKDLEFRVLQNQINPHFLYNTLNSIKWMASIQKANGIVELVSSLAVLLKHISKGVDTIISLEQELDLVKEYCTIQKYRSGSIAETHIEFEEDSLKRCKIVKFTLQPIVENALFHGIEPKMQPGTIRIRVYRYNEQLLYVDIEDDGVGIDKEKITEILINKDHTRGDSFNKIGLNNVDERIKLAFGSDYGLEIHSEKGVYTRVRVRLPLAFI